MGNMVGWNKKIRVLVVDDSLVFREVLSRGLSSDSNIEIVATANDPFEARDKIIQLNPDVMTCDIEMPKMNGIEFIRRLIPQHPLPTIVVSTVSNAVFDAMNAGAVDFVTKPDLHSIGNIENFIYELIKKIKIASNAKILSSEQVTINHKDDKNKICNDIKVIAIGASTGGTEAITRILKALPNNIPGIVIVQHIPIVFSRMFAERLNSSTNFIVKEAKTGDYVIPGQVLISPGDRHMIIKKIGEKLKVECIGGAKVNGHCPSIDILFESVSKEVGKDSIGIILTGMGYDGAKGLLSMRKNGATTFGQDEDTSVVYGMPKVAYNIGAVDKQLSINKIAHAINYMIK